MTVENDCGQITGGKPVYVAAYQFKEPGQFETLVKLVIYGVTVLLAAAIVLDGLRLGILRQIEQSGASVPAALNEALQTNTGYQQTVLPILVTMWFAASAGQLAWIYLLNRNAHALGAQGMWYTPGWSVGCFFVPLLNLFQPYEAMAQLSKASASPADWKSQPAAAAVAWWWWISLLAAAASMYAFFLGSLALLPGPNGLFFQQRLAAVWIAVHLFAMAGFLIFIPMMSKMSRQQLAHHRNAGAAISLGGQPGMPL